MKIWILALSLLLSFSSLTAQSGGSLEVTSDPPGTAISLEGEYNLAGITPTVFSQPLSGSYLLKAARDGYETYETRLNLVGASPLSINIKLAPKTRFKAFLRSMAFPGWGQIYAGEKIRGVFYSLVAVGSGLGLLVTDQRYRDKKDDYDKIYGTFLKERSIEKKRLMEQTVEHAREQAYDAETLRNVTLGVVAGVWAYNLLDAVLFFPDRKYDARSPRLSLETGGDNSRIGLALNLKF